LFDIGTNTSHGQFAIEEKLTRHRNSGSPIKGENTIANFNGVAVFDIDLADLAVDRGVDLFRFISAYFT
jgi:hypothetical protein